MAAEAAVAATAAQSVSAQILGNAFVQQYYQIQHTSPDLVYRFYQDINKLGRPEEDGSMSITNSMQGINEKIVSLNYADFRAEIKTVDLNDMFRYVDVADVPQGIDVVVPCNPEPIPASPVLENHVSEQSPPSAEEPLVEEVYDPPQNGVVLDVEEEVPVAEVVDEVPAVAEVLVASRAKVEDVPKKSYASIVMHFKESAGSFSPAPAVPRRAPPKKAAPTAVLATDSPVVTTESVEGNNHEQPEGSIEEAYIVNESLTFLSMYLPDIETRFNRPGSNCLTRVNIQ